MTISLSSMLRAATLAGISFITLSLSALDATADWRAPVNAAAAPLNDNPGNPDNDNLKTITETLRQHGGPRYWPIPFMQNCQDVAHNVGVDIIKDLCSNPAFARWQIDTVVAYDGDQEIKYCHDATMVTSPSGRRYLFDPMLDPLADAQPLYEDTEGGATVFKCMGGTCKKHFSNPFTGQICYADYYVLGSNTDTRVDGTPLPPQIHVSCLGDPGVSPTSENTRTCVISPRETASQDNQGVQSFDPNDKAGTRGFEVRQYVSEDVPLRYVISFENMDTATAAAQEVIITDDLAINENFLDFNKLSLGAISFGERVITPAPAQTQYAGEVDLRPEKNLLVRINAALNSDTNILSWHFASIDPDTGELTTDPLAGFLPPNTDANAPAGSGSVAFTVMPKPGLATGTEVRNAARIVFDTNAPIDTPEWLNTIDNDEPTSEVMRLDPTQPSPDFRVEWSGADVGAGIKDYTIYVSEDGGPFTAWLINTPDTSATFAGEDGKTYAFYSVAQDQVGNIENAAARADTSTQVKAGVANRPPSANAGSDLTVESTSPSGASVTLDGTQSTDPDNDPLTFTWSGPFGTAQGAVATVSLPNGSHTVTLAVTDGRGGASTDTLVVTVQDTTPPSVTLEAEGIIGNDGWYRRAVTVHTSGSDAGSGIVSCTDDQFLTTDSAGITFYGRCTDAAGNVGTATLILKRDATPPETTGKADVSGTRARVTLTASDNLSGIHDTWYRIDNGGWQSYSGPFDLVGAGLYTIGFYSTDVAGNEEAVKTLDVDIAVPPEVDTCLDTNLLDNFNRANGGVGSNWSGVTGTAFYRIASNRLDVQVGGPIVWKPQTFGTSQAATVTLSGIDPRSPGQGLLLKAQGGSLPNAGAISVVYDARAKAVRVATFRLGALDWTPYGNVLASVNPGDRLTACAKDDGEVRVYRNDTLLSSVTLNAADRSFFNGKGGRIGLWSVLAPSAFFDDFGGKSVAH